MTQSNTQTNRRRLLAGGFLLAGLLAAGAVAALPERPAVEAVCLDLANEVSAIGRNHPDTPCQGDLVIVATYLKTAAPLCQRQ